MTEPKRHLTIEIDSNSDVVRLIHSSRVLPTIELPCHHPHEVAKLLEEALSRIFYYAGETGAERCVIDFISVDMINEENRSNVGEW